MSTRTLAMLWGALLSALMLWPWHSKAHPGGVPRTGRIVAVHSLVLTMTDESGTLHSDPVAPSARITLDGRAARLNELRKGFFVAVDVDNRRDADMVVSIDARSRSLQPHPQ